MYCFLKRKSPTTYWLGFSERSDPHSVLIRVSDQKFQCIQHFLGILIDKSCRYISQNALCCCNKFYLKISTKMLFCMDFISRFFSWGSDQANLNPDHRWCTPDGGDGRRSCDPVRRIHTRMNGNVFKKTFSRKFSHYSIKHFSTKTEKIWYAWFMFNCEMYYICKLHNTYAFQRP